MIELKEQTLWKHTGLEHFHLEHLHSLSNDDLGCALLLILNCTKSTCVHIASCTLREWEMFAVIERADPDILER